MAKTDGEEKHQLQKNIYIEKGVQHAGMDKRVNQATPQRAAWKDAHAIERQQANGVGNRQQQRY